MSAEPPQSGLAKLVAEKERAEKEADAARPANARSCESALPLQPAQQLFSTAPYSSLCRGFI